MLGTELQNPRPKYGYTAGVYFLNQNKKDWTWYGELSANTRGSRFRNGDSGYSRIAALYVDAAFLPMYKLNDSRALSIGPFLSYNASSSLFIGGGRKAQLTDVGLSPVDAGVAAYFHITKPVVSYQFGTKFGLLNANNSVNFENVLPPTGTGGTIYNLSFEIGLLF